MRVIVTRPAAQAADWVARLRERGVDAVALPLIEIAPLDDPAPLRAAWREIGAQSLVMFVSANAVERFFAARPAGQPWPAGVRAGATGPGTAAALLAAGVPPAQLVAPAADAPSFDSEALWALLQHEPWAGRRALVVRGAGGRDWFAERLREQGAQVAFVTAYRRLPPRLDAPTRALLDAAQAAPADHVWAFSSSEAIGHLLHLLPQADWSRARALASHERIAQRARAAGYSQVDLVRPDPDAVAAWLQRPSIQSAPL